jgi:hypothetical protein
VKKSVTVSFKLFNEYSVSIICVITFVERFCSDQLSSACQNLNIRAIYFIPLFPCFVYVCDIFML